MKAKGDSPDPEQQEKLIQAIKENYDHQTSPYYAAARLWIDAIIDPTATRKFIATGIEAASHAPVEVFNPGVIQT